MQWLAENWFWVLLIAGFVGMHLFGHSHGGHGSGRCWGGKRKDDDARAEEPKAASGHRH
jgi:hypothetical protein